MKEQVESRGKIKEGIKKRRSEMDDRAKHMGFVVEDKKNVADTSRKLNLATTQEGANEIKKHMKQAANSTHNEFTKQNQQLETKIKDCRNAESDLKQRTANSHKDAGNARSASGKVKETKEAKQFLGAVEKTSNLDAKFTEHEKKHQEQDRKKSENRRNEQKNILQGTKLKW